MGIEHLQGRRTGRRRGSKSGPFWLRAARWAAQNLGKPDAAPPSPLAARLLTLGLKHPDRLTACLTKLEIAGLEAASLEGARRTSEEEQERAKPQLVPVQEADEEPRRVRTLTMPRGHLSVF